MHTITWRRRLVAALVLPFVLLLAGCGRFIGEVEVKNVDELHMKFDIAIKQDQLGGMYSSAEEMCKAMDKDGEMVAKGIKVESYEEDGMYGCRAEGPSGRSDFSDAFELTEEKGEYHLRMKSSGAPVSQSDLATLDGVEFTLTFVFPGKVTESKAGTIDGNKVKYTSIEEFTKGVDITAKAGGFPTWAIILIVAVVLGFLLLLVVAAIAFFVIRGRKNKGPKAPAGSPYASAPQMNSMNGAPAGPGSSSVPSAPGQPSPYGQPSPAPQGGQQDTPWGNPPQGQPPQAQPPQGGQQGAPWGQPPQGGQQPPQNPGW